MKRHMTSESEQNSDECMPDNRPMNPWKIVLDAVLHENADILSQAATDDIMWAKIINLVKEKVIDWLEIADNLRDSEVYQLIQAEEYRLMQNGYDNNEAEYAAWLNRKMAIKDVLQNALAEIAEGEEEQEEKEDEEEQEQEDEEEQEDEDEDA
jgi:hypothetical protein